VTELLLRPIADAFLQVGVPVALLAAVVAWARVRYGTRALDVLVRHRRLAPVIGAALGVLPGCGGAILVMILHLRGRASFGTAMATLTATMGDASFVLLAADPVVGLAVHGVLFVTGVVTGYVVDAAGWEPRPRSAQAQERRLALASAGRALPTTVGKADATTGGGAPATAGENRPAGVPCKTGRLPRRLGAAPAALWVTAAVGSLVAVPFMFGLLDPLRAPRIAGLDLWLLLGVAGFLACLVLFLRSGCRMSDDTDDVPADLPSALTHGAVETAFITTWVSAAFVVLAVLQAASPVEASALQLAGAGAVLIGVVVAIVPGCGTQIAFTGLYVAGALPLPGLLANAVAQDGDALLPVLAEDRHTAVALTVLTSIPALLVGGLALLVL
jgi:hypothetical protein